MSSPSSEEALLAEALKLPPEARDAFLGEACGDDAILRRRMDALLQAVADGGQFLEQPPATLIGHGNCAPHRRKPADVPP